MPILPEVAAKDVERWSAPKVWLYSLFNKDPESNRAAVDLLDPGPGDRLLDLGCGLGAALEHARVRGTEVAGIDPSAAMVERARERLPGAEIVVGSAEEIPFSDSRFTKLLTVATFHHWADPDAGLAEALRVLAPGGKLLIVEGTLRRRKGHGLHPEAADELAARLGRLGYQDVTVTHIKAGRHRYLGIQAAKPIDGRSADPGTEPS